MQFDIEYVENSITKSPRKNGCYNLFFKLTDKIGIKLSLNKEQRDYNYKYQTKAAEVGLGPETYGIIDNVKYRHNTYYGYFTEIVEVLENLNDLSSEEWDKLEEKYEKEQDKLYQELLLIGYYFDDVHTGNIGWKDGKMICIDFDKPNDLQQVPFLASY